MPIQQIPVSVPTTLAQNEVAALPAVACFTLSSAAMEGSADGSTGWAALTGLNTTGLQTNARFVRCTTGSAIVSCKKIG